MCIGCYALTVMTLISPVNEAPQFADMPELNQVATQAQVQDRSTPEEVRDSIDFVLERLPKTLSAQPLRNAFTQMRLQLVNVNGQEQVYEIVNEHMVGLSEQVNSASNSDELLDILYELGDARQQPQASILLNLSGKHWGWIS